MTSFLLRATSAGIKFLFIIYLSYEYDSQLLGVYVILTTIVLVFGQILGLELNVITGRNIHRNNGRDKWVHINRQYIVQCLMYFIFFPIIFIISYVVLNLDFIYVIIFCFIILVDSFLGEVFRSLVSNLKVYYATLLNFFRSALYILILISVSVIWDRKITVEMILLVWCISLFFVFCVFIFMYRSYFNNLFLVDLKLHLIIKECIPYFAISLLAVIFTQLDKFVISYSVGASALGHYYVVFSICTIMTLFVSFTVGINNGPKAIKIFSSEGFLEYMKYRPRLLFLYLRAVGLSCLISVSVSILYSSMIKEIEGFFIMLFFNILANVFLIITDVYKCDLYLYKKDYKIFKNFCLASIFSVFSLYLLVNGFGIVGGSVSMFLSSILLFALMKYSSRIESEKMFHINK